MTPALAAAVATLLNLAVQRLGPAVVELLATLVQAAVRALAPDVRSPATAAKADALGTLLATAVRVVDRLATDPGLDGERKRAAAQRILARWNQDNAGGAFAPSELNLTIELAVQHQRAGGKAAG